MQVERQNDGKWQIQLEEGEEAEIHASYRETLPTYLTCFDVAFETARARSEFEFLLCLLRPRGFKPPGWDPYETTVDAIQRIMRVHDQVKESDAESARHLELWLYGHIVEASEPYELLANLIDVANGGRFRIDRFPPRKGRPQSPAQKTHKIRDSALAAGMPQVATPLIEVWDRTLRNAIFHADYVLFGPEIRTFRPYREYSHEDVLTLVNRALAYHEAIKDLHELHIESYEEPGVILVHPDFSGDPDAKAIVIVREGHGAVGLKDAWSQAERQAGKISFRVGHFYRDEIDLLDANPDLALLPSRSPERP